MYLYCGTHVLLISITVLVWVARFFMTKMTMSSSRDIPKSTWSPKRDIWLPMPVLDDESESATAAFGRTAPVRTSCRWGSMQRCEKDRRYGKGWHLGLGDGVAYCWIYSLELLKPHTLDSSPCFQNVLGALKKFFVKIGSGASEHTAFEFVLQQAWDSNIERSLRLHIYSMYYWWYEHY